MSQEQQVLEGQTSQRKRARSNTSPQETSPTCADVSTSFPDLSGTSVTVQQQQQQQHSNKAWVASSSSNANADLLKTSSSSSSSSAVTNSTNIHSQLGEKDLANASFRATVATTSGLDYLNRIFEDLQHYIRALDQDNGESFNANLSQLTTQQMLDKVRGIEKYALRLAFAEARELERGRMLNVLGTPAPVFPPTIDDAVYTANVAAPSSSSLSSSTISPPFSSVQSLSVLSAAACTVPSSSASTAFIVLPPNDGALNITPSLTTTSQALNSVSSLASSSLPSILPSAVQQTSSLPSSIFAPVSAPHTIANSQQQQQQQQHTPPSSSSSAFSSSPPLNASGISPPTNAVSSPHSPEQQHNTLSMISVNMPATSSRLSSSSETSVPTY